MFLFTVGLGMADEVMLRLRDDTIGLPRKGWKGFNAVFVWIRWTALQKERKKQQRHIAPNSFLFVRNHAEMMGSTEVIFLAPFLLSFLTYLYTYLPTSLLTTSWPSCILLEITFWSCLIFSFLMALICGDHLTLWGLRSNTHIPGQAGLRLWFACILSSCLLHYTAWAKCHAEMIWRTNSRSYFASSVFLGCWWWLVCGWLVWCALWLGHVIKLTNLGLEKNYPKI